MVGPDLDVVGLDLDVVGPDLNVAEPDLDLDVVDRLGNLREVDNVAKGFKDAKIDKDNSPEGGPGRGNPVPGRDRPAPG